MVVVHDQLLAEGSESLGDLSDQIAFCGSSGQDAVDDRVRARKHLQGMRRREDDIIRPAHLDRTQEIFQPETVHGILEITG